MLNVYLCCHLAVLYCLGANVVTRGVVLVGDVADIPKMTMIQMEIYDSQKNGSIPSVCYTLVSVTDYCARSKNESRQLTIDLSFRVRLRVSQRQTQMLMGS